MPANKPYPGEDPRAAAKRIARNRSKGNAPQVPATKAEMMGGGYEAAPERKPRRKPGYNFTKNLGNTPDIGY